MAERSPDDPWDAIKRLVKRDSAQPLRDAISAISHVGLLAKGIGMKLLAKRCDAWILKDLIVNTAIRYSPNFVAKENRSHHGTASRSREPHYPL